MAEEKRFELLDGINRRWFSRPVHSTTLPPLRCERCVYYGFTAPSQYYFKNNHKFEQLRAEMGISIRLLGLKFAYITLLSG